MSAPKNAGTDNFLNRFTNNLFGSIARGSGAVAFTNDFIPTDGKGGTVQIQGDGASWLGLRNPLMQKYAYEFCFPLSSVIDKLASMDINGNVEILRKNGKGKNDYLTSQWANSLNKLLAQPNTLQTWSQFRGQQVVYKKICGFCPVLPILRSGFGPEDAVAMINLPPWLFDVTPGNGNIYSNDQGDLVKEYTLTLPNKIIKFRPEDIFILEDSFFQNESKGFLLPQSRLVGLDMAISNICASMEADNVLLRKKGPLGFISHDAAATKDSVAGYIPLTQTEQAEVQLELRKYGMSWSDYLYAVTKQPMKWNSMSYNVKELGTKETVVANEKAICHRFDYSYVLYDESEAVYAAANSPVKNVYQNNVIPSNEKDLEKYEKYFKADANNAKLCADFLHLPALQTDQLAEAQAANAWNEALEKEYKANLITKNMWLEKRGYEKIGVDGDKYYKDENKTAVEVPPVE